MSSDEPEVVDFETPTPVTEEITAIGFAHHKKWGPEVRVRLSLDGKTCTDISPMHLGKRRFTEDTYLNKYIGNVEKLANKIGKKKS